MEYYFVSLIVVNYNDYVTTINFLGRIKDYESINRIIVVDNHSEDQSYDVLKKYENKKIKVIETSRNGGYGYGNNIGIKFASKLDNPDFLIISNPDVMFEESVIKEMIAEVSKDDKYSCVAPVMCDVHGNRNMGTAWKVPNAFQYTISSSILLNKLFTLNKYKDLKPSASEHSIPVECLAGSFFMVKTKDMLDYGLYDEAMFLYCEETYLGIQMKKNNRTMLLLTDSQFVHAHGVSIKKTYKSAIKKSWMVWKNKEYLMRKYMGCSLIEIALAHLFFSICSIEQILLMICHKG